jgi:membrane protein DedA with SNARE-associated domain
MLTLIGREVGDQWEDWKDSLHYVDYAVAAGIVLGAIWLYVRWRRGRGPGEPEAAGEPAADAPH